MHQGRGLQRVAHPLVPHLIAGDTAQLPVNQRHKPVEGVLPAKLQLGQQPGNFPASVRHTRPPFQRALSLPSDYGKFFAPISSFLRVRAGSSAMRTRKLAVAIVWWGFALVFDSALGWCGARQPESPLKAIVRTYNYAQAPGEVLAGGERMAAEIFRYAGIELLWIDCPISLNELEKSAACKTITDLTVNILPESMASRFGLPHSIGVTVQQHASFVFYHRVRDLADNTGLSESAVLGPVMAHELGHLLLGEGVHSDKGIMMADLSANNLREAAKEIC